MEVSPLLIAGLLIAPFAVFTVVDRRHDSGLQLTSRA